MTVRAPVVWSVPVPVVPDSIERSPDIVVFPFVWFTTNLLLSLESLIYKWPSIFVVDLILKPTPLIVVFPVKGVVPPTVKLSPTFKFCPIPTPPATNNAPVLEAVEFVFEFT